MESEAFKQDLAKASKGDVKAMNNVAEAYFRGKDAPKDLAKSFEWFRKGGDKGNAYALYRLGLAYQKGWGCDADEDRAIDALKLSLDKGGTGACKTLAAIYADEQSISYDRDQLRKYAEMGIANGCDTCMFLLGRDYALNHSKRALPLLQQAADKGNTRAMVEIGQYYRFARGTEKDEAKAFDWFKKAADAGDATGCLRAGRACYRGEGSPVDKKLAAEYGEKARAGGELEACEFLYDIYSDEGPLFDSAKAIEALEYGQQRGSRECERLRAEDYARKGNLAEYLPRIEKCAAWGVADEAGARALSSLAIYHLTDGNDPARGFGYLAQIMKQFRDFFWNYTSSVPVFYVLCLLTGHGTQKDPAAGMAALKMAADFGNDAANDLIVKRRLTGPRAQQAKRIFGDALQVILRSDVRLMLEMRKISPELADMPLPEVPPEDLELDVAPYLDPVESVTAAVLPEAGVIGKLRERAEKGDLNAMFRLGKEALRGRDMLRDDKTGVMWLRTAGDKGHLQAQVFLATAYRLGDRLPQNDKEAAYWIAKAATGGDVESQYLMGLFSFKGMGGIPASVTAAVNWYTKAAQAGHAGAMTGLGGCYLAAKGTAGNETEAFKWFCKAADAGDAGGQYLLAQCFIRGWGVPKNPGMAQQWLRKAAEQGHAEAKKLVGG